jgi:AhpD family alkylhydroperoxidase
MATESTGRTYGETREEIEEALGFVPGYFDELNERDLVDEWPIFRRYAFEETEIPAKYRELVGLAVAANIKCPYCQLFHREAAKMHGATEAELAELEYLASWTARYSSLIHAQNYDTETFEEEFDRMAAHLEQQLAADD